jgi:hypothetical protein
VVATGAAVAADAVVDDQMSAMYIELEPVAVSDTDAAIGRLGRLSLNAKGLYFRVPCPRAGATVAGAIYLSDSTG